MRRLLLLALVACKGKEASKQQVDNRPPTVKVDWKACDAALKQAATAPLDARPTLVIDGCKVCGDWTPILDWARPQKDGGPKRVDIDAAMQRCGYCDGNGKQRFLGTLDNARGTDARTPWRQLGEMCKEQVSATDLRFMSAPYYALDRIGRAAATHGGDTATLLAALQFPLPAMSVAGTGVILPTLASGVSPKIGDLQISVIGDQIFLGTLPRATLGTAGVTLDLGPDGYPGKAVKLADLAAGVGKLVGDDKTKSIALVAPFAMPAEKLVPVIAVAGAVAPLYLAASALESPQGWQLPGAIPFELKTDAAGIHVTAEMTVQNLATEITAKHSGSIQP